MFKKLLNITMLMVPFAITAAAQPGDIVDPLKTRTFHVAVRDGVGYLSVTAGLKLVDLSNPKEPSDLSTVVFPQSAVATVLSGNIAYVAQGPAGVYAVDISDPANPKTVSHIETLGSAMMVDTHGKVLAVADGSVGVSVFDISDPSAPAHVASHKWSGYARGLRFYDGVLYVCSGKGGVAAVPFQGDAASSEGLKSTLTATSGDARDIDFYRDVAFVADGKHGVTLMDISDRAKPQFLKTFPTADFAHGVAFHKGHVFVADGLMGVTVFKFEKSKRLEKVASLETNDGYADKVTVADRKLFVANDYKGLLVFDIRRPEKPILLQ